MNHQTIVWGSFCLLALGAALRWPVPTRRFLGGFFIVMGLGVNLVYVLLDPAGFVRIGTDAPMLDVYAWAFSTVVVVAPVVLGLTLAIYEVALGTMMIIGGRPGQWGALAGIAFLIASTPLSTWTLPNLILAAALTVILLKEPRPATPSKLRHPKPHPGAGAARSNAATTVPATRRAA